MSFPGRRCLVVLLGALVPGWAAAVWRAEGPAVGNVRAVAFAPSQPATVYAGTNGGGVWRSDDGGATWRLPGDGMTRRDVRWVAVDPADAKSVWAGLAEARGGSTVWRSADGGTTWAPLQGSTSIGRMQPVGQPVAFAPTAPKTIYLPSTNLHYRSDDGGKSWRDFRVPNQDAYVVAVHPKDAKIVYAGGRGQSLNLSRSSDGGKTWKQVGVGLGQTSLKVLRIDPTTPTTLYAAGGSFAAIFKSTDSGDNFAQLALPVGGTSDLYDLAIDPSNGAILWAATEDGLFRSDDGGASWRESDRGLGRWLATAVAFDPKDPSHLVAGTGGSGVFESRDGGASWAPAQEGVATGWVKALWGAPGSAALFAQLSVGLFRFEASGEWSEVQEPFERGKSADLDGILFDGAAGNTLYAFDTSKYWRSSDGGRRWQEVEQKGPSMKEMMKGITESAQFASLAQDRGNAKTFYAGSWSNDGPGGAVYKTTDAGKKWTPAGQGVPNEKVDVLRAGAPGTVFAVVDGKSLYRTTSGGGSWSAAGAGLPEAKIQELVVDPRDPTRLFVATDKGLYRSADTAASWVRVGEGKIEGDDVDGLAMDPASGALFAGTFHGVFRSADGGESWSPMADGLTNCDVRVLAVAGSPPRLWAGTAGGSVYSTELP